MAERRSSTSPMSPTRHDRRLSIFSRKEDLAKNHIKPNKTQSESEDEISETVQLSSLLSPRLEKKLVKKKAFFSPLNTLRSPLRLGKLSASFSSMGTRKTEPDDSSKSDGSHDGSEESADYDSDCESVEKLATDDDVLLLLCRELELITDEVGDDYDECDD